MERALALLILAGLVAGLMGLTFGTAYSEFAERRARAENLQSMVLRLENVIQRQGQLADYLASGDDLTRLDAIFLDAPQSGIGTARLQQRIASLAGNSGVAVRRVTVVDNGAANQISLQVQVSGNIVAFSSFLVGLESSLPWLFVDSMNVSQARQRRGPNKASSDHEFIAMLTISAYTGPDNSPASAGGMR